MKLSCRTQTKEAEVMLEAKELRLISSVRDILVMFNGVHCTMCGHNSAAAVDAVSAIDSFMGWYDETVNRESASEDSEVEVVDG